MRGCGMAIKGKPGPRATGKKAIAVSFSLDRATIKWLTKAAAAAGVSRSKYVQDVLVRTRDEICTPENRCANCEAAYDKGFNDGRGED
jgi:hypothetical protein